MQHPEPIQPHGDPVARREQQADEYRAQLHVLGQVLPLLRAADLHELANIAERHRDRIRRDLAGLWDRFPGLSGPTPGG